MDSFSIVTRSANGALFAGLAAAVFSVLDSGTAETLIGAAVMFAVVFLFTDA